MSGPVTLAIVGCGERAKVRPIPPFPAHSSQTVGYARRALSHPHECRVVATAEPRPVTQRQFANLHNIDQTLVFNTWQDLLAASAETMATIGNRLADAVVIAVHDQMHAEVTLAFAQQGYHILLEKPMATTVDDCLRIERSIKNAGVIFGIGHGKSSARVCLELLLNLVHHSTTLLRIYESFIRHRTQEHSR